MPASPRFWSRVGFLFAACIPFLAAACASTPPIADAGGVPVPGSIATLEKITLNGSTQWITVRGVNPENPILLFLAGGPGGSELPSTRLHLGELEKSFTVVNWDQPGAGKSFRSIPMRELTPERYVRDGVALIDALCDRFQCDKVFILGESWGTVLGVWLCQAAPAKVAAFVGSGMMVDFRQDDILGYHFALQRAEERGDAALAAKLRRQGPPPYLEGNLSLTYMRYLSELNSFMSEHAHGEGPDVDILRDALRAPEYTLCDRFNWVRGLMRSFNRVYPQLQQVDLRRDAPRLDVPVTMVLGRYDVNAMTSLAEEYFQLLQAPAKELVWFEKSGHPPLYSEASRMVALMERVKASHAPLPR